MRFLLIFLFFLTVVTAGVYGAGSSLPKEMITVRGAQFKAPVDEVWDLVTNYGQLPGGTTASAPLRRFRIRKRRRPCGKSSTTMIAACC